jgi:transaldolase
MQKTTNIFVIFIVLTACFHLSAHAEDVCSPEAAKPIAKTLAVLNAIVKFCNRATALEIENSRKELTSNVAEAHPCSRDKFVNWYDEYFNETILVLPSASKEQQKEVCIGGPNEALTMPVELLKGMLKMVSQKPK